MGNHLPYPVIQEVSMQEGRFVLKSPFKPQGDQPQAIDALVQGVQSLSLIHI